MPRGKPGTFTHGAWAYNHGYCREACCREAWRVQRDKDRKEGKQGWNSGRPVTIANGTTALLTRRQEEILKAWLRDAADPETVGRRVGLGRRRVVAVLGDIQRAYGLESRAQMALALERGDVDYEVDA